MAIRIITDSASDILPSEASQIGVTVIPLTLTWDDIEYKDAIDMDPSQFFRKLNETDTIPTTSQIPPIEFEKVYAEVTANGDTAIVITLSSKLSGTCQSAHIAAEDYEGRIFVVDSLSATIGQRLLVLNTLDYIEQGLSESEIVARLEEDRSKLRILAKMDTLEYLKKGGRISSAVAFAGGILSIKPVIEVRDGAIELLGQARGSKNGNNLLRKFIAEAGGINFNRKFSLVYSGVNTDLLQQYIDDSTDLWESKTDKLPASPIGAVIGTHIGPGAIGIAFFEN